MTLSQSRRYISALAILIPVYFVTGKLGLKLAFVHASATAVWAPTGIALAAFLVLGYGVWPGILVGAFLVNLTTAGSVATSIGIAIGNTLEGVVGAHLVNRFARGRNAFHRAQDVFLFVTLAAVVSTTVSSTLGVTSLCLGGFANWAKYGSIWFTWWLGDAVGGLVVAPLLILWFEDHRVSWKGVQGIESIVFLLCLVLVGDAVFGGLTPFGVDSYPLEFLCVPFLVWAALRFEQRDAMTAVFLLSGIALWGTLHGLGPFARETQNESLLLLQAFMGTLAVMTLALAAVASERRQVEEALRTSQGGLELQIQKRTEALSKAIEALKADINERKRVEATLREQGLVLSTVVSNAPITLFAIDPNGIIRFSEGLVLQALGMKPGEHVGLSIFDVYREFPGFLKNIHLALAGEVSSSFEEAGGLDFEVHYALTRGPHGEASGLIGVAINITDRRRAEDALGEIQERHSLLVMGVKEYAIYMLDTQGLVMSWNQGAEHIKGYKPEEIIGKHFSVFYASEDVQRGKPEMGLQEAAEKGRFEDEGWHVRKDGSRFWANVVITALRDEAGNLRGFAKLTRDVTERKRAEETIKLHSDIVKNMQIGISVWRLEDVDDVKSFRLVVSNPAAEQASGAPVENFLGKTMAEGSPKLLETEIPKILREVVLSGQARDLGEIQYGDDHGSAVIYWAKAFPLPNNCAGISFENITERRRMEQSLLEAADLERRTSEITLLSQLGNTLQTCMTAEEAYVVITQSCQKLFPMEAGAVYVIHSSGNVVEAVAVWGDSSRGEQVFVPEDCWALRSGHPHFVDDPTSTVVCRHLGPPPATGYLCVPMMAQGEALGVLHIRSHPDGRGRRGGSPDRLSVSRQQLAVTVAEQIGLALANLRLRETLYMQSIHDPLTGLYNRRYVEESLERELRRAARKNGSLGAIMFDLDHFKRFNDTFGHDAGDFVLRELSKFLGTQVRAEDIACRYGGEEFIIVLPGASVQVTERRAEQLRRRVKHLNILYGGRLLGPITLSLGVAVFPEHGSTVNEILRSVDEALYQAKAEGRDQFVIARTTRKVSQAPSKSPTASQDSPPS